MVKVNLGRRGKYNNAKVGYYLPLNPHKCKNAQKLVYKSDIERRMMLYLDTNASIVSWSYESFSVKYYDPVHKKARRYFIDFKAVIKQGPV